jgi:molecular chaperone Hsp33
MGFLADQRIFLLAGLSPVQNRSSMGELLPNYLENISGRCTVNKWAGEVKLNRQLNTRDELIRATAAEGTVRCMAAVTTNLVADASERHQTSPTVAAALGRTLTGALLMGSTLKELDRLTVQIDCDGPIGGITAEANAHGQVRGYVRNPIADAPLNNIGKFDVAAVVGSGMFNAIYESGLYPTPYRGSVPIVSGEIGEDFAHYLTKSEQIPSAVLLGVYVRARETGDTFIEAAGGLIVQIMPGATDKTIGIIEEAVRNTPQATTMVREGAKPIDMLQTAVGNLKLDVLETREVKFHCQCSYERAISLISCLDRAELESMLREDHGATMICHFCNSSYRIEEAEMERLIRS